MAIDSMQWDVVSETDAIVNHLSEVGANVNGINKAHLEKEQNSNVQEKNGRLDGHAGRLVIVGINQSRWTC